MNEALGNKTSAKAVMDPVAPLSKKRKEMRKIILIFYLSYWWGYPHFVLAHESEKNASDRISPHIFRIRTKWKKLTSSSSFLEVSMFLFS